jgi:PAS domain S-box-containing protein
MTRSDRVTEVLVSEPGTRTLVLGPELTETARARRFVEEVALALGFTPERVFDITVAVSEATANAIEHAEGRGEVRVQAKTLSDRLEVSVGGVGEFHLPARAPDRQHRGLGLPLMATLSDHLALYSAAEGGTLVTLTFYRPGVTPAASALPPGLSELIGEHALLRDLLDNLKSGLALYDRAWRFRYINRVAAGFARLTPEDMLGEVVWELFPSLVGGELERLYRGARESGLSVEATVHHEPWGEAFEVQAFPFRGGLAALTRRVTDEKRAEEALRAAEERFRATFEQAAVGIAHVAPDGAFLRVNRRFAEITGYEPEELGQLTFQAITHPDDLAADVAEADRLRRGEIESYSMEKRYLRKDGSVVWVRLTASMLGARGQAEGYAVAVIEDVSQQKAAEQALRQNDARQKFLLRLNDTLRPLADPVEIQHQAARLLGEHLAVSRVGYAEVQDEGQTILVTRNYVDGVTGIEGRYRVDDYDPGLLPALEAGLTVVRPDTASDPGLSPAERGADAALQLRAKVNVPLRREGRLVAFLFMHHPDARGFSNDEVALVEAVAERTWEAVERARARSALRASEQKYRTLFDSIDEGFCIIEVLFNDHDEPWDYRFVETNRAFEKQTGLTGAVGSTIRELAPDIEPHWFRRYGRIVRTGEAERFEDRVRAMGRHFDAFAFRTGSPEEHRVAVLFTDISERKRAQAELAESESRLATAVEVTGLGIWEFDAVSGSTVLDARCREIFGLSDDRALATREVMALIHPDDRQRVEARMASALHPGGGGTYQAEYRILRADCTQRWVAVRGYAVDGSEEPGRQKERFVGTLLDITDRKQAEVRLAEAARLNQALSDINAAAVRAMTFDDIMQQVVSDGAEALGCDSAAISLRHGQGWRVSYVHRLPPHVVGMMMDDDEERHAVLALKTGQVIAVEEALVDPRVNREHLRKWGIRSVVVAPLAGRKAPLGVIFFNHTSRAVTFSTEQLDFVRKLAATAALVAESAEQYERSYNLAATLQESLLVLPTALPGVEFGHAYRSAAEASLVGGDFFDVFATPSGEVAVIIGDVSGKGVEAASLGSFVRETIRAYALQSGSPRHVLRLTNQALVHRHGHQHFVTVALVLLDPTTGKAKYSLAGHPPPIRLSASGARLAQWRSPPPLGFLEDARYVTGNCTLDRTTTLVLYTDGITEARRGGDLLGEVGLIELLAGLRGSETDSLPAGVLAEVARYTNGIFADDAAVIALRMS